MTLFLGDNGRCFCALHAGHTARATGHDLSGQRLRIVSAADRVAFRALTGTDLVCESCPKLPQPKEAIQ